MASQKKILVAVLNWGLGHASRCVPIINELIRSGASVCIASDGRALELLKKEFPGLPFFKLPNYGVKYFSKNMALNMLATAPRMAAAILQEYFLLIKIIKENKIDGIVSDNRLGCFSKKIPAIFVTHQINLIGPNKLMQYLGRLINYFFIKKHGTCWVPDVAGEPNLSGKLSHNVLIKNVVYIGALSRMKKHESPNKYRVVAVLSGPEPQRTNLEKVIIEQAKKMPHQFLIIQGKTEKKEHFFIGENIEVKSFLNSKELNEAILSSEIYVGRSGYSSIMDLIKLNIPALLIPTPGQTEQEYLSELLAKNNFFHFQKQENINLEKGIMKAKEKAVPENIFFTEKKLKDAVGKFLITC